MFFVREFIDKYYVGLYNAFYIPHFSNASFDETKERLSTISVVGRVKPTRPLSFQMEHRQQLSKTGSGQIELPVALYTLLLYENLI